MQETRTPVKDQWINIPVFHGNMEAYLAKPSGQGPWPAIIVLMEIFGVNAHIQDVTRRIAAEGFVAIAPNYYHRTTENMELDYSEQSIAIGRKHKDATTRENFLIDLRSVIQMLQEDHDVSPKEKMGCIGFCFGGHLAYIAASFKEIVATAVFYPGGLAIMSPGGGAPSVTHAQEIQGEMLCFFGEKDAGIPHEQTVTIEQALQAARVPHEVIRYSQAGHGFFCDRRADYEPSAADDAWHRSLAMFKRVFRG